MKFEVHHYHHHSGGDPVGTQENLFYLARDVSLLLKRTERFMAAIDDLKAAIADLATELADNNAEIEALLTKITATGTSDADVAAAVASIRSLIADNKAEVDKAKAAAP